MQLSLANRPHRYVLVSVVCAVLFGITGCDRSRDDGHGDGDALARVTRTAREGPVTLTITALPGELPFTERAEVIVEVLAEQGVTVEVVDYEHTLGETRRQFEYRVATVDRRWATPTSDGRLRWVYHCELEFFLPGEYELPPPTVTFVDERNREDAPSQGQEPPILAEARELTTEPLTIIARDTSGATLSPEALRDIATLPPVELAERWRRWWWIAPPIVAAAALLAMLLARRRRRRQAERAVTIPAHEWARQQIAALIVDDLIAHGRVQEFYYRISGIVRGYIERRYRVLAMEMTTEEFLTAAASDARFGERATRELNRFLCACDLVKYARHEPASAEAGALLRTASDFVERTRETVSPTDVEGTERVGAEERAA